MIKVTYNTADTLVRGNYPDDTNYPSITIDLEAQTILSAEGELLPYIEISNNEQINDKLMCVKDGVYQEFIKPDSELLQEAKDSKITQISIKREVISEKSIVTHNSKDYANSQNARVAILRRIASLNDVETKVYFTYPDQEVVNLNKADFEAIAVLIEDKELLARQKEGDFISQVKVCLTVDEVNDINIDFS